MIDKINYIICVSINRFNKYIVGIIKNKRECKEK